GQEWRRLRDALHHALSLAPNILLLPVAAAELMDRNTGFLNVIELRVGQGIGELKRVKSDHCQLNLSCRCPLYRGLDSGPFAGIVDQKYIWRLGRSCEHPDVHTCHSLKVGRETRLDL